LIDCRAFAIQKRKCGNRERLPLTWAGSRYFVVSTRRPKTAESGRVKNWQIALAIFRVAVSVTRMA